MAVGCSRMFRKVAGSRTVKCEACGAEVDGIEMMEHVMRRHPALWAGVLRGVER